MTDTLPTELAAYYADATARLGQTSHRFLGVVDRTLIRRYAIAIDDPNPIYHDPQAAHAAGFDDIVAPPNMLSAMHEWGAGHFESELAPDGTRRSQETASLRLMGAGENLEIVRPVTAGAEIHEQSVIEKVELKNGRSGPLVFVTTVHNFVDGTGALFNRNKRTILARL